MIAMIRTSRPRLSNCPDVTDPNIMPAVIGIRISPEFVADCSCTPCRKRGRNWNAPNMPAPSTIVARIETV